MCYNEARLIPRNLDRQQCLDNCLDMTPVPSDLRNRRDFFGNLVTYFTLQERHEALTITSTSEVSLSPPNTDIDLTADASWARHADAKAVHDNTVSVRSGFVFTGRLLVNG